MSKKEKLKVPPYDLDAETYFLNICMNDGEMFDKSLAKVPLIADMFFSGANRIVFDCINTLYNDGKKTFDPVVIINMIDRQGNLSKCPRAHVLEIFNAPPRIDSAIYFAEVIKDNYDRRSTLAVLDDISERVYQRPMDEDKNLLPMLLGEAESKLHRLQDQVALNDEHGPENVKDICTRWYKEKCEQAAHGVNLSGIKTGFTDLDKIITGLRPGTMNIFAAQPGVGKTAIGLNLLENIVCSDDVKEPAIIFSLEMTKEMMMHRILANLSHIPVETFQDFKLTASDADKMMQTISKYEYALKYKLLIDDTGRMTPSLIRQRCRRIADRVGGVSCILVDHVQIMHGDERTYSNDVRQFADISRSLKIISKDFKCPVIVLSQLSRKIDDRKDHEPKNSDLKETSGLEQDADLICFIQRDTTVQNGEARLKITKNRHGSLGEVKLGYYNKLTSFMNPAEMEQIIAEEAMRDLY